MSEVSGDIPAIKADAAGDGDHPTTLAATGAPVGDARLAEPAQFRMVLVSFLAAAIGLIAGLRCLSALQAYWPVHKYCFLSSLRCRIHQRATSPAWSLGNSYAGNWRRYCRLHGQIRHSQNQGTRHSRGHGSGAD